jgi:hypothetical protein
MLLQTSTKKMFQLPRSVTCLARHLLDLHQVTKTSNKSRRLRFSSQITWTCSRSGIYCWFWNRAQFNVLPCSPPPLSLSLSILPHQRIRRPRSGWPAVRSARLASYLGKVVSFLQSIYIATWSLYCDSVAFRLLLIGSLLIETCSLYNDSMACRLVRERIIQLLPLRSRFWWQFGLQLSTLNTNSRQLVAVTAHLTAFMSVMQILPSVFRQKLERLGEGGGGRCNRFIGNSC